MRLGHTVLGLLATLVLGGCGGADEEAAPKGSGGSGASSSSGGSSAGGGSGGAGATSSGGSGASTGGSGGAAGAAGSAGGGAGGSGGAGGGDSIKLIAIGDTGEGNQAQKDVAQQMATKCAAVGGCTAVLMLGDNFYDHGVQSTSDAQWNTKFESIYDLPNLNSLKFYATLGNHDYGVTSTGKKEAQIQYTQLPVGTGPATRPSDMWMMPDAYYDVKFGDVHVFAIDTQDYSSTQKNDMKARVQASSATWKIVMGHHPRYTSGNHYWDNALLGAAGMYSLLETIYCGTDLLLTGHDHNVEFIDKGAHSACPSTHFAISGAGAKTRTSTGLKHGKQLYYNEKVEALAYLEFKGKTLLFEFIDKHGTLLWSKTITKP